MEILKKTTALLLFLVACSNPDKKPETVKEKPLAAQTDSLIKTDKDGVTVEKPALPGTAKMPAMLTQKLAQKYPGWKLPEIPEKFMKAHDFAKSQGPGWVRGDFDGNKQEDYGIQVQVQDSVYILAFLQQKDSLKMHVLHRDKTYFLPDKTRGSMYYLTFLAQNDTVFKNESGRKFNLPHDAIAVTGIQFPKTAYYFQGRKLITVSSAD